jgi:hypothetical protein
MAGLAALGAEYVGAVDAPKEDFTIEAAGAGDDVSLGLPSDGAGRDGEGEVEADGGMPGVELGEGRGLFRLVALVNVGCIVGGICAPPTPGLAGVGGNVEAVNISPEYPGAGPGIIGLGGAAADAGRLTVASGDDTAEL